MGPMRISECDRRFPSWSFFYPHLQSPQTVKIKCHCNAVVVIRFVPLLLVRNDWNVSQEVAIFKDWSFKLSYGKDIFQTEYRQHCNNAFKERLAGYSFFVCVFKSRHLSGIPCSNVEILQRSSVGLVTEKWILDNIETAELRVRSPECSVICAPYVQKSKTAMF